MRNSIQKRLTLIFIGLAVGPLLLVGAILAWQSFVAQQQQALKLQQEMAHRVATEVTAFFEGLEDELRVVSQVQGLRTLDLDKQRSILFELLSYNDVFETLILLDNKGQEQIYLSRLSPTATGLGNRAETDEFLIPQTTNQVYYSPVRFEETTGEPLMTIAVPLLDPRTGQPDVILVSEIRVKKIWNLIGNAQVGKGQSVYIVDAQNRVVAHRTPSVVLRGTNFNVPNQDGIQPSLTGANTALTADVDRLDQLVLWLVKRFTGGDAVLAVETAHFGNQEFNIVSEQIVSEALALAINTILITIVLIVIALVVAGSLGFLFVYRLVRPIQIMATSAEAISAGDLSQQVDITRQDELGVLATAFNSMTTQLRNLVNSLEERITDRTRRLEIVATLGEQLNAILDADDLLCEVVNQIKQNFGYYHVHIYLFDDSGENLVVAAGTGSAGAQMIAQGYSIPRETKTSLVARSARSGEIVMVENVQEVEDWLSNPLLPDTQSEMAVPIMQKGDVIGVLDVQEDKVGGLDESDASLLRSLANQVAVALKNARLFEQTARYLDEIEFAKEKADQAREQAEEAREEAEQAREEAEQAREEAEQAREEAEQAKEDIEIANKTLETQVWQTTGQAELNQKMQGEQDMKTLARSVIRQLCHYLQAQMGALYIASDKNLNLLGSYAYSAKKSAKQFKFGEKLVGQAALEQRSMMVTDIPTDYVTIGSALGETLPKNIMVFPFMYENRVVGIVELGTLTEFTSTQFEFIQSAMNSIAIAFNTAQARDRINELLAETQQQAEELQAQSEELRVANEELETQTKSLQASEAQLKDKQAVLDQQNRELKIAQEELEQKAEELARASKYKSEFLANMSHELRTPLNSLLILARMLADNKDGNLTQEQIESAQIIHSGGTDLLNLINDILDLSKVEAGQMVFNFEAMPLTDLVSSMRMQFDHMAEEKGLDFNVNMAEDLPGRISTDPQRVKQVVKNLLSNAFKFTSQGSVSLNIYRPDIKTDLSRSGLDPSQAIAISVVDTGIGMTPEQQNVIFEAFQQADGSTSRQYGGTGLGLSISREMVSKLGGQIEVGSEPGKGSTFTLYLPIQMQEGERADEAAITDVVVPVKKQKTQPPKPVAAKPAAPSGPPPKDDRDELEEQIAEGEWSDDVKVLLIIEDDPKFAKVVYDYSHEKGFKCLISGDGATGLELVKTYQPAAIILDLNLPDMSGWEVLTVLKNDPATRHIPIHIISGDEEALDAYRRGAMGYLTKPVKKNGLDGAFEKIEDLISRDIKTLLVVEDDANSRRSIKKLLGGSDVKIKEADLGQKALSLLNKHRFDCMILDLSLPDMSGFEVLNKMNNDENISHCPVIVYTGRDLTPQENQELMQYADSVIVKGVKSPERLLDETALFLHQVVADMPNDKRNTIHQLHTQDTGLEGKKIMIVDDDMRNSFALSKLLADKGIVPQIAHNGQKALDLLAQNGAVDLILMDIMMPVMDGYETIKQIRNQPKFNDLPILALTAKAMKGDREKCLAAGANDYLSKPIDVDRLFSMLRVWLYQ